MVDSWTPGDNMTLVKSPYYYKRGAIYLDKIVFKYLPTAGRRWRRCRQATSRS